MEEGSKRAGKGSRRAGGWEREVDGRERRRAGEEESGREEGRKKRKESEQKEGERREMKGEERRGGWRRWGGDNPASAHITNIPLVSTGNEDDGTPHNPSLYLPVHLLVHHNQMVRIQFRYILQLYAVH